MQTNTMKRAFDILMALAAGSGIAWAVGAIISSERAMHAAGRNGDGLEALGLCLGAAALPFFVPSLFCTLLAMRNDSRPVRNVGRALTIAGFCGGPVLLFLAFATIVWH